MGKQVTILLIEDDDVDAMAVEKALKQENINNPVIRAVDGLEGLQKLRGGWVDSPYMVLLDLNTPRMNGLEFLAEIRQDEKLRSAIVFVYTTSASDKDRLAAYSHNIAGYLLKDGVGKNFLDAIKLLNSFWQVVEFP